TPLECPFLMLRPTKENWFPLLLLNGTSVETGRRIVTTLLLPTYASKSGCPTAHRMESMSECLLLTQTIFFHDLLAEAFPPPGFWARFRRATNLDHLLDRGLDDIRLSTAAHNSARFPVISPPGAVRNSPVNRPKDEKNQVIDRIVDGGYFENY